MWEYGVRMDLWEIGLGGCRLDSTGSGQGPVVGCCECGDEPSGSCATELVSSLNGRAQRALATDTPLHPQLKWGGGIS
jgi:hypothetical protein